MYKQTDGSNKKIEKQKQSQSHANVKPNKVKLEYEDWQYMSINSALPKNNQKKKAYVNALTKTYVCETHVQPLFKGQCVFYIDPCDQF